MSQRDKIISMMERISEEKLPCIRDDAPLFQQLEWDSMSVLRFLVEVEDTYSVTVNGDAINDLTLSALLSQIGHEDDSAVH